jgi:hypothetical protein
MVNLPNLFKYLPSLFNTFNCLDDFLQMFEIWELNLSSKSIVTPSNFISFSHYNDYNSTYENLLIVSKLPTLKVRRLRTMAIEVYKILHQKSPSYLHDLIKIKDTKYCFRYDNITEIPLVRTTKCHESGQKLKLDNMNEWYMVNLSNLFKYLPSLFNTFNCLDAFLQMFEIWELNLSINAH